MTGKEPADAEPKNRTGENRLPPAAAVVVAIVVYALLPSSLLLTGRLLTPIVEALLLIALIATNPRRMNRETRWSRGASIALAAIMILTNLASLGLLVSAITGSKPDGARLLVAAVQIWGTNVIGFALMYWEIDRGGPVVRARRKRSDLPLADWRFSQDEDRDTVIEVQRGSSETSGWLPTFVDYLYVSLTNSSAFSPTDTMPLSPRAKLLMGTQASTALFTSLVLVAFAVSSLGG
ncbi:hypothetical protein [Nocardioides sp. Kera G14]|uniref:hypothetical protein n=1 Tax=Nocardioides sp. Kera G14 TaxID=2884264 RepID=UPI001D115AED|nr:hypothetical protein [Nocardioides sp. Kera G14]UDY23292.1 hypothetical protein LH076_14670 [Nocardioides sp. Kera G14]